MRLKTIFVLCVLLLTTDSFALFSSSQSERSGDNAIISGIVTDLEGKPVPDAEVEVHTFGPVSGMLPNPARTDREGRYKISYPPLGEGVVSASKPEAGYANAALALYDRENTRSLKHVNLTPGLALALDLVLEAPDPIVVFEARDAVTGQPIENARILVEWSDDSDRMTSQTIPKDGTFILVLPQHAIAVTISAPGRAQWQWKEDAPSNERDQRTRTMRKTVVVALQAK